MHISDRFVRRSYDFPQKKASAPQAAEVYADTSALSALSQVDNCPTSPTVSPAAKTLSKQGRALGEQIALHAAGGPALAPAARQLSEFRQGICPYLTQQIKNNPGQDLSSLSLLSDALSEQKLDAVDFFKQAAEHYGPSFQVGGLIFETRPEVALKVLVGTEGLPGDSNAHKFSKSPLQIESLGSLYGHENIFLNGQSDWKARRSLMQPFFVGAKVLNETTHTHVLDITNRHLDTWAAEALSDQPLDLNHKLTLLTLDSGLNYMFGVQLSPDELEQTAHLFKEAGRTAGDRLVGRSTPPPSVQAGFDRLADRILKGRKAGEPRQDMLQALLDSPMGQNPQELRQELMTMTLLGHETTANLLSWTVAEMARHPHELEAYRAEISAALQNGNGLDQTQSIGGGADIIRETARLHPPNFLLMREALEDDKIDSPGGSLSVKAGDQILMPLSVVNSHSVTDSEWNPNRKGGKMFSFGAGTRVCMGQVFARLEAAVMLRQLTQRFDFSPVNSTTPGPATDFSSAPADSRYVLSERT